MHIVRPPALLLLLGLLAACQRGPSRKEALAAIRSAQPALDSGIVQARVWEDGPPWFSCAEVIAKLASPVDSAAVRDPVGNWKYLVLSGWVVLRDTASGVVADPGWCTTRVTPVGAPQLARWTPAPGPAFPTGTPRRGWTVPVGRRRVEVAAAPSPVSEEAARADYRVTVIPNPDGRALGADRDTARFVAELRKVDGAWRMTASHPAVRASR